MEAEREECAAQARDERGTHTRARAHRSETTAARRERRESACMYTRAPERLWNVGIFFQGLLMINGCNLCR